MPTKKELKHYKERYYDIPKDLSERMIYLINNLKLTDKNLKNIKKKIKSYKNKK